MFCHFSCLTFYYLLSGSGDSDVIKLNESLTIQPRFLQHIWPCLVLFIQSVIEAIIGCEAHIVREHVGGGKQQSQVVEGQRYCTSFLAASSSSMNHKFTHRLTHRQTHRQTLSSVCLLLVLPWNILTIDWGNFN